MKQQTAVEWLIEEMIRIGYFEKIIPNITFEEAKQMEREQIQKAFADGQETPLKHPYLPHYSSQEYYNDTYKKV